MPGKVRRRKLATEILTGYLAILIVTVLLGVGLITYQEHEQLDRHYQERALAIAHTVAGISTIREAMESGDGAGVVQIAADQVRRDSGAAYVVVIDRAGIRHSHPNPALVGQSINEPVVALDGRDRIDTDPGKPQSSARARVPLRGPSGAIVGAVSVGFLESSVWADLWRVVLVFSLYAALALAVGVAASFLLARRLKRTTYGLELHEIASLLSEREAMLHGVREGVVTVDVAERITLVNDEARRLLRLGDEVVARRLDELLPEGRLRDVLSGAVPPGNAGSGDLPEEGQIVLTDEHCLEVNRMPVRLAGQDLGAVVTLRDRTEMEGLLRELDNVRGLTDALRAQSHEFANRIHTISGLLELGDIDEALAYIADTEGIHGILLESVRARIGSSLVAGLFLAKTTVAAERGVQLILSDESLLEDARGRGKALLTVIGNLVDNAVDAAAAGSPPAHVLLDIRQNQDSIQVTVSDSGPGVAAGAVDDIFEDGVSTKPPRRGVRRGLGLALVRRLVQNLGGEIQVANGPDRGAVFAVVLPTPGGWTTNGELQTASARR